MIDRFLSQSRRVQSPADVLPGEEVRYGLALPADLAADLDREIAAGWARLRSEALAAGRSFEDHMLGVVEQDIHSVLREASTMVVGAAAGATG